MMVNLTKIKLIMVLTFVITLNTGKCYAFPVWFEDFKRIGQNAFVILQQASEIKQEVDSNLLLIKEIQQGGYAAAASDLFLRIQEGDYDRFGNNLKMLKTRISEASANSQFTVKKKANEEATRTENMVQKVKDEMTKQNASAAAADTALQTQKKKSIFNNAYEWLKNNRTTTDAVVNSTNNISNGNWQSIVNDAAQKSSEALTESGYEGYGSIVNNSNNAINSALQGDWSGVVNSSAGLYSDTHANEQEVSGSIRDTNNTLNSALQGDWEGAYNALSSGNIAAAQKAKEEQNNAEKTQ